jgi:hypothetical protein
MRSDARKRLIAIAGGGLSGESGVTGVAVMDAAHMLRSITHSVTPPEYKNFQLNQCVTPATPGHTQNLGWRKRAAEETNTEASTRGVTIGVIAAEGLARLDPTEPPCDVPLRRWFQFIDDSARFLREGWAPCAEALGWTLLDLFGCDGVKPFARISRAGLLWLIDGKKLLALSAKDAAIATPSGGTLKYRRCPNEPGRVPAWELFREAEPRLTLVDAGKTSEGVKTGSP